MDPRPRSPRRHHILSSINPERSKPRALSRERRSTKRRRLSDDADDVHDNDKDKERRHKSQEGKAATAKQDDGTAEDPLNPRARRLHLKDPSRRRRRHHQDDASRSRSPSPHRHRHRRHHRPPTPPNPYAPPSLSADAAFLESLFDAMADDEGAEYWQSVYGQPVHELGGGRAGLDAMGEEEYVAHVRARMWERTEEGREEGRMRRRGEAVREEREREEREREEREREERERKRRRREREREREDGEIVETLARGEARKKQREARRMWDDYIAQWARGPSSVEDMAWPIPGRGAWGKRDVSEGTVRAFLAGGLQIDEEEGRREFVARLREERVRWHPDKMQQRLGGEVEEGMMRDVTAVFQVVDKMWNELR